MVRAGLWLLTRGGCWRAWPWHRPQSESVGTGALGSCISPHPGRPAPQPTSGTAGGPRRVCPSPFWNALSTRCSLLLVCVSVCCALKPSCFGGLYAEPVPPWSPCCSWLRHGPVTLQRGRVTGSCPIKWTLSGGLEMKRQRRQ